MLAGIGGRHLDDFGRDEDVGVCHAALVLRLAHRRHNCLPWKKIVSTPSQLFSLGSLRWSSLEALHRPDQKREQQSQSPRINM